MFPELVAGDVLVTNARDVHGPVVAEHALALLLALAKRLPSALRYQQARTWGQEAMWQERPRPRELTDSTLVLVGMGSIGRELAARAAALGMRVLAVREHPQRESGAASQVFGPEELDRALAQADFVVIAAPLTPSTRGLFDAARLARMKPDAYLVNVSRGPIVDEAALAQALRKRTIAGAALDVFEAEPLPQDSPLWDLDNLLITPHTAAVTEKLWERHYALIRENLRRFLAAEPLLGLVDKRKGY
jgi:phosphoglycerate dehydrogenase-like enzyme